MPSHARKMFRKVSTEISRNVVWFINNRVCVHPQRTNLEEKGNNTQLAHFLKRDVVYLKVTYNRVCVNPQKTNLKAKGTTQCFIPL